MTSKISLKNKKKIGVLTKITGKKIKIPQIGNVGKTVIEP